MYRLQNIQRLHETDVSKNLKCRMGILFAIYAWNASPIYRTDINRSFSETGDIFTLPFDITKNNIESQITKT